MLDAIPRRLPAETLSQYLQRLNAIDPAALDGPTRHCLGRRIIETEKVLGKAVAIAHRRRAAGATTQDPRPHRPGKGSLPSTAGDC